MRIKIPGRVYEDALDPSVTEMLTELGLPQPEYRPRGRGGTYHFDEVDADTALELASYLDERSKLLSGQSGIDMQQRELYRTMTACAYSIRHQVSHLPAE